MAQNKVKSLNTDIKVKAKTSVKKVAVTVEKVKETRSTPSVQAKETKPKTTEKKQATLSVAVYDINGKVVEQISLSKEIFDEPMNKQLLAQAVRVYLANQRMGSASTKTRGEVRGSTRKIYRQKGTGRARHGGVRAPIFVHGGIAHGPKPTDFSMHMATGMKRKALAVALSDKQHDGEIKLVAGLEKMEPKTKLFASFLAKLIDTKKKQHVLLVTSADQENVLRAAGNIKDIAITAASRLNTYDVVTHRTIILMQDSLAVLEKTLGGKE